MGLAAGELGNTGVVAGVQVVVAEEAQVVVDDRGVVVGHAERADLVGDAAEGGLAEGQVLLDQRHRTQALEHGGGHPGDLGPERVGRAVGLHVHPHRHGRWTGQLEEVALQQRRVEQEDDLAQGLVALLGPLPGEVVRIDVAALVEVCPELEDDVVGVPVDRGVPMPGPDPSPRRPAACGDPAGRAKWV